MIHAPQKYRRIVDCSVLGQINGILPRAGGRGSALVGHLPGNRGGYSGCDARRVGDGTGGQIGVARVCAQQDDLLRVHNGREIRPGPGRGVKSTGAGACELGNRVARARTNDKAVGKCRRQISRQSRSARDGEIGAPLLPAAAPTSNMTVDAVPLSIRVPVTVRWPPTVIVPVFVKPPGVVNESPLSTSNVPAFVARASIPAKVALDPPKITEPSLVVMAST